MFSGMLKRAFDLAVATVALVALSPLLLVLAIWIKFDSLGPVFYRSPRAGRYGRPFQIVKLRTMYDGDGVQGHAHVPGNGRVGTASDDPRITRVGRLLRRYKLDELPQLINVLKGEMSIVGPRPEVVEELDNYTQEEQLLLGVRPGMTDPASIKFWHEADMLLGCQDQEHVYYHHIRPGKVRLRLDYVRHQSLCADVRIILQTAGSLLQQMVDRRPTAAPKVGPPSFLVLSQYFSPEPGAAAVRLTALCRELHRAGYRVEVVTALPNYPQGRIMEGYRHRFYCRDVVEGILVHRVRVYASQGRGLKRLLNYLSFMVTCFAGLAKAHKPDYVFIESPPLFLAVSGLLAAWWWRVPSIFTVADLWPDSVAELKVVRDGWLLRAAYALEAWTYRHSAYVNAVTWGIREQLRQEKHVPESKLLFMPNGIDTDMFKPLPPRPALKQRLGLDGQQVVLYAGNHGYAHDMDSVLQAATKLRADANIHFLLVGSGSAKPALQRAAREQGLRNMTFLEPVPPEVLAEYMAIAVCGLASTRDIPVMQNARPVKALTVMGCGKPVILAAGRGSGRFIEEAEAGLVVPVDNPDAIALAIRFLVDHPEEAARLGRNGRNYICQNLRWEKLVGDWLRQLSPAPLTAPAEVSVEHAA
jgi:lipopolysaccharide/colanic/teichoic acid biosynthesis glycosyltransferase/glycosyltransferase involved in cell wall biosynthesis